MENGTVIWKACDQCYKAEIKDFNLLILEGSGTIRVEKADFADEDHPEPFNDGKYLHYTRFHPQLRDMIGTEGYFYDDEETKGQWQRARLIGIAEGGNPQSNIFGHGLPANYAYFAVPIKPEKTEITLQEIADKFGVSVEQLRIKE